MPFQITIESHVARTDDFTLDETIKVEKETEESWLLLNPFRSAVQCRAVLGVVLRRHMNDDEAEKVLASLTIDKALDCLDMVDDDLPDTYEGGLPLVEKAEQPTPGLSTASAPSAGPPP